MRYSYYSLNDYFEIVLWNQIVNRQINKLLEQLVYLSGLSKQSFFILWHFDWAYLCSRLVAENTLLLHELSVLKSVWDNHREKPERSFCTVGVSRNEEPILS